MNMTKKPKKLLMFPDEKPKRKTNPRKKKNLEPFKPKGRGAVRYAVQISVDGGMTWELLVILEGIKGDKNVGHAYRIAESEARLWARNHPEHFVRVIEA